ncbi:fatty acid desaturase family protein [Roseiconus lacunae]|uniref:fatty acid desaturase family protein n=1 Tax=Roseiconus lacunae TaxID=2605694 RepID=UPI001E3245CE|nr:fatty acid desaturase family protein [Roseiconus lacunae]MCD0460045.1 fatty acid desaturase family protein [Roseiconus lacunae]
MLLLLIKIAAAWLLADFLTGVFHWFEDRYLSEHQSLDFARGIATDNVLHHTKPTAMLQSTRWENMRSAALVAWPLAIGLASIGVPFVIWAGVAFASLGNLIHRFAHEPKRNLPRWVRGLQEFGVFISPAHHNAHHRFGRSLIERRCASVAYCPMTDFVNPVLDRFRVWDRAEAILRWVGIKPFSREGCPE